MRITLNKRWIDNRWDSWEAICIVQMRDDQSRDKGDDGGNDGEVNI